MARQWNIFTQLILICLLLTSVGCANFWDEALSSERDWNYAFGKRPDPFAVLETSRDSYRRQQAIIDIKEPLAHGGTAQEQEAVLKILAQEAKEGDKVPRDPPEYTRQDPNLRLAAIGNLGNWKDPRAARILEDVYQLPKLPFTADINSMIRQHALRGLEKCHDPESRHLLVRVARQPGPSRDANLTDRQQTQDEKLIAIRALRQYKEPECVDALKFVLKTEKDIALRDCALESLQVATNKIWPESRDAWQGDNVQPLRDAPDSFIERAAWWFKK